LATNPIILHDNARAHTADAVKEVIHRWQREILEYAPFSPHESIDYDILAKMKEPLRGTHYGTREENSC
jgi:transposase